jgi:hypothetical protein
MKKVEEDPPSAQLKLVFVVWPAVNTKIDPVPLLMVTEFRISGVRRTER